MKYLKKYNENNDDISFHIQQIEDIFLDVKDELGLEKYVVVPYGTSDDGFFYYIQPLGFGACIRVWVAKIKGGFASLNHKIKDSQTLVDFESRLRNMGYTFERKTQRRYYEIIISYDNI